MNEDSKAGLLLHEAVYNELILGGATQPTQARMVNAFVSSTRMAAPAISDFVNLLFRAGFKDFEYKGVTISFYSPSGDLTRPLFYPKGSILKAFMKLPSTYSTAAAQTLTTGGCILFHESGGPRMIPNVNFRLRGEPVFFEKVELDRDGYITAGLIDSRSTFTYRQGPKLTLERGFKVNIDRDGYMTSYELAPSSIYGNVCEWTK